MARWACAEWRSPRPTSPAACARSWAATPSSPAHGNEDAEFLSQADFAFCAKYFPHYEGTIAGVAHVAGRHWVSVAFGRGNVEVMDPLDLTGPGFTIDQFKVFAIKSRVHFRRGFDDSSFAKTILLVEPEQPFLGTIRLEALPYRNVDISKFYPYGDVSFPE